MDHVIEVNNIRKTYPLYAKKTDKLKEALSPIGKRYHRDFEALKGISFQIGRGECVGLIGLNGSGKSTLLKILTGVIQPTSGSVRTEGKIAALLELGAGFNPEYTGMENIYLNTLLMGYTREETDARLQQILDFADIGDFINQPVKIYSSGMFVRLAFSIAVAVEPDILIIDEALSVGDIFFQQKCFNRIRELAQRATVLIVSHDLNSITKFCKRVLVMNKGVLIFDGDSQQGVTEYYKVKQGSVLDSHMREQLVSESLRNSRTKFIHPTPAQLSGKMDVVIDSFYYQIDEKPFAEYCQKDQIFYIRMLVNSVQDFDNLIVGFQIRDKYGNEVFGETSITSNPEHTTQLKAGLNLISFQFVWPEVREGDYFITLGIGTGPEVLRQVEQCWVNQAIHIINTTNQKLIYGMFNVTMENFEVRADRCE